MNARTNSKTTNATTAQPAEKKEYNVSGTKLEESTKVKFVANPKRVNSAAWERYEKYQTAATFGEYLQLNPGKFAMADARHDLSKGFLKLADAK